MESSNTSDLVTEQTTAEAASAVEEVVQPTETPAAEVTPPAAEQDIVKKEAPFRDRVAAKSAASPAVTATPAAAAVVPAAPAAPAFTPNFKYKAFGKEKELDEMFRPLVKDADSEKKVKDIFTRADAFDDMKTQKEAISYEHQRVLQAHTALDRDVRRITGFLNKGDYDNFFASVKLSDEQILRYLQHKAEISKLSPQQQFQYNEASQLRANQFDQNEQMQNLQSNYSNQAVQTRTMQLDFVIGSSQVSSQANLYDSAMGPGAFRNLVTEVAANHWHQTKQDLPADAAVQMTLQKYGGLLSKLAPQVQAAAVVAPAAAPQAQVAGQAKPVIPAVPGRGASPIKQAPKSLDDLKKLSKKLQMEEANPHLNNE